MTREEKFMLEAVKVGTQGMRAKEGGPFGCVIVRGDEIIGRGCNRVLATKDPTSHAEVVAIRDACKNIGDFQLTGCELYTTCEPCPMCLGAIYWARPSKVYYACKQEDAAAAGFDDSFIYKELDKPIEGRKIPMICISRDTATNMFEEWIANSDKTLY